MRQTRVKWLVGGLMVSAGGLVAIAGIPNRSSVVACDGPAALPIPMVNISNFEPPVPIPAPTPAELPQPASVTGPVPLTIPLVESSKPVVASDESKPTVKPLELPKFAEALPVGESIIPAGASATPTAAEPPLPASGGLNLPDLSAPTSPTPMVEPLPVPTPVSEPALKLETPTKSPVPSLTLPEESAQPQAVPTFTPAPVRSAVEPTATPVPQPVQPATLQDSQFSTEKKLKVILHLGDERPRFEVRDGDEVYLKVICDRVDVKSPSDQGESMSTLRASGKVTFMTPGGEGTCQELSLAPGTGQVVVGGQVSFKYNWGKVETTVSGTSMTFRLGSVPSQAPSGIRTIRASGSE